MTPQEINKRLGEAIKARRVLIGMSQEAIGRRIGVTFQQIQKYEKGVNAISVAMAVSIAHALEWDLDELFANALNNAPCEKNPGSDRATLEMMKRFRQLGDHEQDAIVAFIKTLVAGRPSTT